jgi:twinkle protein
LSCVEKLPHECGSSDALQVFEENGKFSGFCFACSTYVPDPYRDKPQGYKPPKITKTQEEIDAELSDIESLPFVDLASRKLSKASLEYFGIRVALSEIDGSSPVAVYFPAYSETKLTGYKARLLEPKRFWAVGTIKGCDLFGWQQALNVGGKKLFITEGEFDAVALYEALVDYSAGSKWEQYKPAVVSLTNGSSGAVKNIQHHLQDIKANWQEIILVFDQDEPGQKAVKDVLQILPHAKAAKLPSKDPNQCLLDGRKRGLAEAVLFRSDAPKNTRIVKGSDLHEAARQPVKAGLSWPWKWLTKTTRGIRFGETVYIGAGVKMGKSEVVNTLATHLIKEHNLKVFLAKPEEANNKTYKLIAGKLTGKVFHDPEVEFDYEAFDSCKALLDDKLYLLNLYQHVGWKTLKQDIVDAVHQGCKAVFIDPITNLVNGIDSGQANTILQEIAQELAAMARDLDIVIFIFCHLRAPDSGPPHERGGKVESYQFSGSRAMMRSCNYMIGIEGNKDPELPDESKNIRKIVMLEDREFGTSGYFRLYWDRNTGLFNELDG